MSNRRHFLKNLTALLGTAGLSSFKLSTETASVTGTKIACQQYPWGTFFQREGKKWTADLSYSIGQVIAAGFEGFEPSFNAVAEIERLQGSLKQQPLQTYSLYVNSVLHDPERIETSTTQVLQIAEAAKAIGAKIIVTNPSPIRWGSGEDKTDEQLELQAKALNELGAKLRKAGLTLAYHNHDAEMRNSAREFHHMMLSTDPENVHLCLDAHWIYRGAGNSQVALFDIVKLYVDRIVELHLRQSKDGIWTEAFGPGDIDYEHLVALLSAHDKNPHLVLEQAVEKGSPHTMDAVRAHRLGRAYVKEIFFN